MCNTHGPKTHVRRLLRPLLPALLLALCLAAGAHAAALAPAAPAVALLLLADEVAATPPPAAARLEILVSPDTVRVPESGTVSVKVALSRPPDAPLTVSVARVSGDPDLAVAAGADLTFTADDWYVFRSLTLTAAPDADGVAGRAGFLLTARCLKTSFTAIEQEATPDPGSHAERIASYEGTATCLSCHMAEAMEFHASDHYQWQASTVDLLDPPAPAMGKRGSINDYCTYPDINWLGLLTTADGRKVDGGCAKCHAGLGLAPEATATDEQLRNIDCLVCHAPDYQRTVAETAPDVFRLVPDTQKMAVSLLAAAQHVVRPGAVQCLGCHTKSGGGNNFKRGDIEEFHKSPTREFDVHLAAVSDGGAGLACTDCHLTENHRIAGRGSDLMGRDSATAVTCVRSGCHSQTPHATSDLNKHTAKVNCTVCHIPSYAKVAATDVHRDFSQPGELSLSSQLYEPHMERQNGLTPVYRFWNGTSAFYFYGDAAVAPQGGRMAVSRPEGGIAAAGAKLYAFKYHQAEQARDVASGSLIPLKMGILFSTGNATQAVAVGAATVGFGSAGTDFVSTERYQGLFHGVEPKENALACADCHTEQGGTRLDFAALGYAPLNPNLSTCSTGCHSSKADDALEWKSLGVFFTSLHRKHVTDRHYDCSRCHGFSRQ